MKEIQYIGNNPQNGIKYDFDLVRKEFRKLKIPKNVYNPSKLPFDASKWFMSMSERSRGKTTNIILLGMVFNKLYGTELQYLRLHEEMITKKNSKDLFSTISVPDYHYIEILTDGKYNGIKYDARRWYYCRYAEDGLIESVADKQFMTMLSIDKAETYKSSYNAPTGDYIIIDEFIERYYYPSFFLNMMDLIKTIARDRMSVMIFMLSNTINKESQWFNDFNIRDAVEPLRKGEHIIHTTPYGTNFYIEILGERIAEDKRKNDKVNQMYYGFDNNKLSSITGAETWSIASYPRTPKEFTIIRRNHYIEFNSKLVNLEICQTEDESTIFINCHYATRTYSDSVIYSLDFHFENNYRYKKGITKIDRYIWDKYDQNLFTYSDNSVGDVVEKFVDSCKRL